MNIEELVDKLTKNRILLVYGEAGTGKTTLGLMLTIRFLKENKKVLFLDTENSFSIERFQQIAGHDFKILLDNILVLKVKHFKDQQEKINSLQNLINHFKPSLIIFDSISPYYRRLIKHDKNLANSMLNSQLRAIKNTNIPSIIVSQVYSDLNNNIKPLGYNTLANYTNNFIELKKEPRTMILFPEKNRINFEILNDGIKLN